MFQMVATMRPGGAVRVIDLGPPLQYFIVQNHFFLHMRHPMAASRRTFLNTLTAVSAAACTQRVVMSEGPVIDALTKVPNPATEPLSSKSNLLFSCKYKMIQDLCDSDALGKFKEKQLQEDTVCFYLAEMFSTQIFLSAC